MPKKTTSRRKKAAKKATELPRSIAYGDEGWDAAIEAVRQEQYRWGHAEHYLYCKLFPWYGPAVLKACPAESPTMPWSDKSEAMRQVRLRAMREWTALTGLPPLSSCEPDRWYAAAVAAGMEGLPTPDVRTLPPEKLAEIILPWVQAIRAKRQQTELGALSKPMAKEDIARELGYTTVRSLNRLIERGGIKLIPHGKLFRYYVPLKVDGTQ